MMCSNGLRKSFWKRKLASSPFSKNFMESCLSESTAKMATSSLGLQPTCRRAKWSKETDGLGSAPFSCFAAATLSDLVEVVSDDLPNTRPLQPDAVHVVVGDFYDLLQAEHPRLVSRGQLIHGHRTEPPHKIHCKTFKWHCSTGCFSYFVTHSAVS